VQADGSFQWSTTFKPPLPCGSGVPVKVHGAEGIALDGSAEVFSGRANGRTTNRAMAG
jgi:hypothetical protein